MSWLLNWWFMLWLQYSPYRGCSFSLFPGPSWSSSRGTQNDQSCGVCADRPYCCSCCGLFPERGKREVQQGEEEKVEEKIFLEQWLTLLPPLLLLDLSLLSRLLLRLRSLVSVTYTTGQYTNRMSQKESSWQNAAQTPVADTPCYCQSRLNWGDPVFGNSSFLVFSY